MIIMVTFSVFVVSDLQSRLRSSLAGSRIILKSGLYMTILCKFDDYFFEVVLI